MKNLLRHKHGAGGYYFSCTEGKGNTKFAQAKKKAIIESIQDSWTDGVYETTTGIIKRQLMNGTTQFIRKDSNDGSYYFI